MSRRVKTTYDRGYVNAMDKIRVFIESNHWYGRVQKRSKCTRGLCQRNRIDSGKRDCEAGL